MSDDRPQLIADALYVLEPRAKMKDEPYDRIMAHREGDECAERTARRLLKSIFAELLKERDALQAWKESALEVESHWDCQKVGKLLGVGLGERIHCQIEPKILALIARAEQAEREKAMMLESLEQTADSHKRANFRVESLERQLAGLEWTDEAKKLLAECKELRASNEQLRKLWAGQTDGNVEILKRACAAERRERSFRTALEIIYADSHALSVEWLRNNRHEQAAAIVENIRKHAATAYDKALAEPIAPPESDPLELRVSEAVRLVAVVAESGVPITCAELREKILRPYFGEDVHAKLTERFRWTA